MSRLVLGIHYSSAEQSLVAEKWSAYGLEFHFVDTIESGICQMKHYEYVCVAICTDNIQQSYIEKIRAVKNIPVVIISPSCTLAQRFNSMQQGAMQFIIETGQQAIAQISGKDHLQFYLDMVDDKKPLTIVSVGDLYFCLEYRTVEIKGNKIDLTAKEFDIFSLLLLHRGRVFTHDMIIEAVWKGIADTYSRNAVMTHISNLRRKLKVYPDTPNYIKNIRGVGYTFRLT